MPWVSGSTAVPSCCWLFSYVEGLCWYLMHISNLPTTTKRQKSLCDLASVEGFGGRSGERMGFTAIIPQVPNPLCSYKKYGYPRLATPAQCLQEG